jgi:hypothetical protein
LGIFNLIFSIILVYIITVLTKQYVDKLVLILSISLTSCYYCFAVGLSYPIYIKFGFSKSYLFITLPLYLLIILVAFLSERTNFIEIADRVLQYFYDHYFLFLFYGLICGIVMLIISACISYGIFKNLEL